MNGEGTEVLVAASGGGGEQELDSSPERDNPSAATYDRRPSILEMVSHLRESMVEVQSRIGVKDTPAEQPAVQRQTVTPPSTIPHPARPPIDPSKLGLHEGFGAALTAAVSQAMSSQRFGAVRDSLTGQASDVLMPPPARHFADEKNILTVRPEAAG